MAALPPRHALGALLLVPCLLVGLCLLLVAGGERVPQPAPLPEAQGPRPAEPAGQAEPATPARPSPEAIDAALRRLDSEERAERRAATDLLLRAGFTLADLTQLAFRAARGEGDRGLLADLLSDRSEDVLPLLLHRIAHSAPVHRAELCAALGRVRENPQPALAVLVVRALLDEYDGAREAAGVALAALSSRGPEILGLHQRLARASADGSVRDLLPSVLLGPSPEAAYARALGAVLRIELARFPGEDSYAIARVLAAIEGEPDAAARIGGLLVDEELYGALATDVLSGLDERGEPLLGANLENGWRVDETLRALAVLGARGAGLENLVIARLREPARRESTLRALWGMGARSAAVQEAVLDLWWKQRTLGEDDGAVARELGLLLRLLRPEGRTIDRIVGCLAEAGADLPTQAELLGLLAWAAPGDRARARALIETATANATTRGLNRLAARSLLMLGSSEAEMAEHTGRLLRTSRWFAPRSQ